MKKHTNQQQVIIKTKYMASIIAKKIADNDIDVKERCDLETWLSEDVRNQQMYNDILSNNTSVIEKLLIESEKIDADNKKLFSRIHKYNKKRIFIKRILVSSCAAAALLLIFIALPNKVDKKQDTANGNTFQDTSVYMITQSGQKINIENQHSINIAELVGSDSQQASTTANELITIVIPSGKNYQFTLPDSSQVWLNAGSTISYYSNFGVKTRVVDVSGQAYFEVRSDKNKPFIVRSQHIATRVLGTKFMVTSYSGDDNKIVSLVEGSVNITSDLTSESITLKPGYKAEFNSTSKDFNEGLADLDQIESLKTGKFIFRNKKLSEIMSAIEQWYGVDVSYEDNQMSDLEFYIITDKCENLDDLMQLFKCTKNINYQLNGTNLLIKK